MAGEYLKKIVELKPGTFISTGDSHWIKVLADGTIETSKYLGKEITDPATPIPMKAVIGVGLAACAIVGVALGGVAYMMNDKKYVEVEKQNNIGGDYL